MSYAEKETSVDDGRPIELFKVSYSGNNWYYTSADRDIAYLGSTYKPVPCGRSELQPTSDPSKSDMTFTFPRDVEVGEVFRIQPPSEVVSMTVFARHISDSEFVTVWKGRIVDCQWEAQYVKLIGESVFSSLRRPGLRRRYQYQCPHALYGTKCRVDREIWKEIHALTGVSGILIQVNGAVGKPDNYYAGGYVTWENNLNQNIEKRMVRSSIGATGILELASIPIALAGGDMVTLYPGCDHTLGPGGCGRFDNEENFGGTPFIPNKNPFGGTAIY